MTDKSKSSKAGSWLKLRHRAEAASSSLPDLIAVAERAASSVLAGEHRQRRTGSGERFWQFRDYDPADRPQDIDWRQSGKGDRVFVRQKEWQTTQTVLFWLQGDRGMAFHSTPALSSKHTEGVVLALSLALLLTRRGELTGLLNGSHRPGRGSLSLQNFGEDLTRIESGILPRLDSAAIPAQASLVLIGDFLAELEQTKAVLGDLGTRASNLLMIQVLDPAELDLPFSGRVIFEEMAGEREHQVMNVESVRDAYHQRIEDHLNGLQSLCRHHNGQWILHQTDADITATLFKIWQLMSIQAAGPVRA